MKKKDEERDFWEEAYKAALKSVYGIRMKGSDTYTDINGHIDLEPDEGERLTAFTVDVKGPKKLQRHDKETNPKIVWVEFRRVIRDSKDMGPLREVPEEYVLLPNNGWLYGDEDFVAFIPDPKGDIYTVERTALLEYAEKAVEANGLRFVEHARDLVDRSTGEVMFHTLYSRRDRHDLVALFRTSEIRKLAKEHGFIIYCKDADRGERIPVPEYLLNYKRKKKTATEKNYYMDIYKDAQERPWERAEGADDHDEVSDTSADGKTLENANKAESEKIGTTEIFEELWARDREAADREAAAKAEWDEWSAPKKVGRLSDFLKKLFGRDGDAWESTTAYEKQRNAFMVNRIMAIQYPTSANSLNTVKTDGYSVTEVWRKTVGSRFTRVPNWAYTKTGKSETDATLSKFRKDTLLHWCSVHECGLRELREQYSLDKSVVEELSYIESNITNSKKDDGKDI